MAIRSIFLISYLVFLTGCGSVPNRFHEKADPAVHSCFEIYDGLDNVVQKHKTIDYSAARVPGFPFLRVTPVLAVFKDILFSVDTWKEWTHRLHELAIDGFALEISHLPENMRLEYETKNLPKNLSLDEALTQCGSVLLTHLSENQNLQAELRLAIASVSQPEKNNYPSGMPFFTSLLAHQPAFPWLNQSPHFLENEPSKPLGMWVYWVPPQAQSMASREEIAQILQESSVNPLHIPDPNDAELEVLYNTFAPLWQIDFVNQQDTPFAPHWNNTNQPTVYRHISYTLWGDQVLLQLNYSLWFYSNFLHGVFWRVTLAPDGTPLLLDAFHSCKCNSMVLPSQSALSLFILPQSSKDAFDSYLTSTNPYQQRFVVRLHSGNHFIHSVSIADKAPIGVSYNFENYWALRALPVTP